MKLPSEKTTEQKAAALKKLYAQLEAAAPKLPLARTAKDIVPGEGPATTKVLFIGEAPGAQEAVQRRPFVGRSGQLFRRVLNRESGIDPEQVYISNIVKVRPPDNRDPNIEELAAYKKYLDAEIEILQPRLIVTLGRFSMNKFLPKAKISRIHGRLHKVKWDGKTNYVLPMYHPAAALRATRTKNAFIEDFKKIPKIILWIEAQWQKELEEISKQKTTKPRSKKAKRLQEMKAEFEKTHQEKNQLEASVIEHLF